jgi:hypothetical protein
MCGSRSSVAELWSEHMWSIVRDELREIAWVASMIGGLSVVGVSLAVVLAAAG